MKLLVLFALASVCIARPHLIFLVPSGSGGSLQLFNQDQFATFQQNLDPTLADLQFDNVNNFAGAGSSIVTHETSPVEEVPAIENGAIAEAELTSETIEVKFVAEQQVIDSGKKNSKDEKETINVIENNDENVKSSVVEIDFVEPSAVTDEVSEQIVIEINADEALNAENIQTETDIIKPVTSETEILEIVAVEITEPVTDLNVEIEIAEPTVETLFDVTDIPTQESEVVTSQTDNAEIVDVVTTVGDIESEITTIQTNILDSTTDIAVDVEGEIAEDTTEIIEISKPIEISNLEKDIEEFVEEVITLEEDIREVELRALIQDETATEAATTGFENTEVEFTTIVADIAEEINTESSVI